MNEIRDTLNKIKWTQELSKTEIWYVHRGAPQDTGVLQGSDIVSILSWCIETKDATIPFHRVFRILYDGAEVYSRKKT